MNELKGEAKKRWVTLSVTIEQELERADEEGANLKELLEKNVRNDIDGLPFNEEGYKNAKAILEAK